MRKIFLLNLIIFCNLLAVPPSVYLNTARIAYHNEQDYNRAKKACLEGIKIDQKNFEFYVILGGCEIGLGNWLDAAQALYGAFGADSLKTASWISKQPEGDKYYYQSFFFSARGLFEQQKYEDALKLIRYAQPDISTYTLKGAILYKLGNKTEASAEYQKALDMDPENPDVNFMIGKVLFDSQSFDSCLSYLDKSVKAYGLKYARITNLIFQAAGKPKKDLILEIAKLWADQKLEDLDRVAKKDLGFAQGLVELKGNLEQFFKVGGDLARACYYQGLAYHNLGKDSLALDNMIKCLELKPDDLDALYFAGEALIGLTRYKEAMEYFEKVVSRKEDDRYAWFNLAICQTHLVNYKTAVSIYETKVLVYDPTNLDAMTNLVSLYNALGNKQKANEYLMKADSLQKK